MSGGMLCGLGIVGGALACAIGWSATAAPLLQLQPQQNQNKPNLALQLKEFKTFSGRPDNAPMIRHQAPPLHGGPGVSTQYARVLSTAQSGGKKIVLSPAHSAEPKMAWLSFGGLVVVYNDGSGGGAAEMAQNSSIDVALKVTAGKGYFVDFDVIDPVPSASCKFTVTGPNNAVQVFPCASLSKSADQHSHLVFAYLAEGSGGTLFAIKLESPDIAWFQGVTIATLQ